MSCKVLNVIHNRHGRFSEHVFANPLNPQVTTLVCVIVRDFYMHSFSAEQAENKNLNKLELRGVLLH